MKEAGVKCDWNTYTSLASIYVKEGIIDKANSALKEVENMDKFRDRKAYHILLTLYSAISNKLGVYQVWESLKLTFPETTNINYHFMLQALSRLGDTDGLEKYFEEWESSYTLYDIRLTNILIDSYLERDMIEEAEKLREDAVKKGAEPNVGTLMKFMRFYLHKHQMKLACKYFEEATLKVKVNHWKASQETVSLFLNYFEEEKDADGAEYFCKLLKNINSLPADVYSSLSRTYVAAGMMESQIHDRLKANGIEIGA
ncbi:hypothetical protein IFM89_009585 [Coptis chinensis]|uniref:Pentatricopeptide repeat-containing protein n=1 Tax=Coptis chinensis TaxID=261450 RepID=A0A835IMA0_9MAGN|nr:hypothetical protein IFM89_009585 [Coptis chinensis]